MSTTEALATMAAVVICVCALALMAVQCGQQQVDSFKACIAAGRPPLECRQAVPQ